jgi:tetratricopeptide (TPR) repeat protein
MGSSSMNDPAMPKANADAIPARPSRLRWVVLSGCLILAIAVAALLGIWFRSNQPESLYLRGRAALQAGDRETARRLAEALARTPGYELHGELLRGMLLARAGLYQEALVHLEPASRQKSTSVDANSAAAGCLYAMGLYLQTINTAQAALQQDPHCLNAMRWLASAYYDLGAIPHAMTELEKLKVEAPTDPRPDRLLGVIAKDGEHFQEAVEHYRESIRRDPNQPDREAILRELAESQIALNEFNEALQTLKESSRSAASLTLESSCHRGLGQIETATGKIREALNLDPRYYPAKLLQGKLFLDADHLEEAVAATREAIEFEPGNSKAHLQLSQALRQLGRTAEADAELKTMLEIQVIEREFTDLHDAAAKQPSDAHIRQRIGALARRLGKPELAKIWFRAALAIQPNLESATTGLREIESEKSRGGSSRRN